MIRYATLSLVTVITLSAAGGPAVGEGPRVRVETIDDEIVGRLERLDRAVVLRDDTNVRLPVRDVLTIDFLPPRGVLSRAEANGAIELTDGSVLLYDSAEVQGDAIAVMQADGARADIPIDAVWMWRLDRIASRDFEPDDTDQAADRLLVKGRGAAAEVEGVVLGVTPDGIRFALDAADPSDEVFARWRRLAAIRFFRPESVPVPRWIRTRDASRIAVDRVSLEGGLLVWESPAGAAGTTPLEDVDSIDLAGPRIIPIGELPLENVEHQPFQATPSGAQGASFDRSFAGLVISLRFPDPRAPGAWPGVSTVRQFRRGLALRSRSIARFRLPASSRRLKGWIGLDPAYAGVGSARVSLAAGGATLWAGEIDGATPPVAINESLEGGGVLTLEVDYGDNLDTGDSIHFADLRVIQ